jgi:hypothetical protein
MDLKSAPLLETTVSKAYVGQAVIVHVAHMPGLLQGVTPSVTLKLCSLAGHDRSATLRDGAAAL